MTRTASGQLPSSRTLNRISAKGWKAVIRSSCMNDASALEIDILFAGRGPARRIGRAIVEDAWVNRDMATCI